MNHQPHSHDGGYHQGDVIRIMASFPSARLIHARRSWEQNPLFFSSFYPNRLRYGFGINLASEEKWCLVLGADVWIEFMTTAAHPDGQTFAFASTMRTAALQAAGDWLLNFSCFIDSRDKGTSKPRVI